MIQWVILLLNMTSPLVMTNIALRRLESGFAPDLMRPAPYMLIVVCGTHLQATNGSFVLWASDAALLLVLIGCWKHKRMLARWAVIACAAGAVYAQWSATLVTRS